MSIWFIGYIKSHITHSLIYCTMSNNRSSSYYMLVVIWKSFKWYVSECIKQQLTNVSFRDIPSISSKLLMFLHSIKSTNRIYFLFLWTLKTISTFFIHIVTQVKHRVIIWLTADLQDKRALETEPNALHILYKE